MTPATLLPQQYPSILSYPVPNPLAPRRTSLEEDGSDLSSDTESDIAVYRQRATAADDSDDRLDELAEKDRLVEEGAQLAGNDHWIARHGARGRVRFGIETKAVGYQLTSPSCVASSNSHYHPSRRAPAHPRRHLLPFPTLLSRRTTLIQRQRPQTYYAGARREWDILARERDVRLAGRR
jgi:hypothetical protein